MPKIVINMDAKLDRDIDAFCEAKEYQANIFTGKLNPDKTRETIPNPENKQDFVTRLLRESLRDISKQQRKQKAEQQALNQINIED